MRNKALKTGLLRVVTTGQTPPGDCGGSGIGNGNCAYATIPSICSLMLSAKRKSDGKIVTAYFESKRNAPFVCLQCNEEVILKTGRLRVDHFAHANPMACKFATGESDTHRHCKMEIFEALKKEPAVRNVALECSLGESRPDICADINGTPVAIEVQISSLSLETIMRRTIEYARKGIYSGGRRSARR